MADLEQLTKQLISEHDALTAAYTASQVSYTDAKAALAGTKRALQEFRAKYGGAVKALEAGAVKVEG